MHHLKVFNGEADQPIIIKVHVVAAVIADLMQEGGLARAPYS